MERIDARGLNCPEPVVKTKDALEQAAPGEKIIVIVDNNTARDNVIRFAQSGGNSANVVSAKEDVFEIEIAHTQTSEKSEITCQPMQAAAPVIFVGSDIVGKGDTKLGGILIKALFDTLPETSPLPSAILFMNSGIKLTAEGSEVIDKLKKLEKMGIDLMVCGTCLDYFNLKEKLAVGKVSNMFDILDRCSKSGNVISI